MLTLNLIANIQYWTVGFTRFSYRQGHKKVMHLFKSNVFLDHFDHYMDMSFLARYHKLIVELGCGDGKLLYRLSNKE